MRTEKIFSAVLLVGTASAHTIFTNFVVDGTEYRTFIFSPFFLDVPNVNMITLPAKGHAIRIPSYNGPITDVTSNSVACNGPPNPTTPSSEIVAVRAGSTVQAKWRHSEGNVIDASHKVPLAHAPSSI